MTLLLRVCSRNACLVVFGLRECSAALRHVTRLPSGCRTALRGAQAAEAARDGEASVRCDVWHASPVVQNAAVKDEADAQPPVA